MNVCLLSHCPHFLHGTEMNKIVQILIFGASLCLFSDISGNPVPKPALWGWWGSSNETDNRSYFQQIKDAGWKLYEQGTNLVGDYYKRLTGLWSSPEMETLKKNPDAFDAFQNMAKAAAEKVAKENNQEIPEDVHKDGNYGSWLEKANLPVSAAMDFTQQVDGAFAAAFAKLVNEKR